MEWDMGKGGLGMSWMAIWGKWTILSSIQFGNPH